MLGSTTRIYWEKKSETKVKLPNQINRPQNLNN